MIEEKLKNYLTKPRLEHSYRVAETAKLLASQHNLDIDKAYFAGLLHDIARDLKIQDLLNISENYNLIKNEYDYKIPIILHAPVGSWIVKNEIGINDEEILKAIECHTLAKPQMGKLAKIIYIADLIEPERKFSISKEIKKIAFNSIDKAVLFSLNESIKYMLNKNYVIHPQTIDARNYYLLNQGSDNFCQTL